MLRLGSAWVIVNALLMAPLWLAWVLGVGPRGGWVALEAALLVGLLAVLPRRPWSRVLSHLISAAIVLVVVITWADLVFQVALARSLNLFVDLYLLSAVYNLAVGNSGLLMTLAMALGALLLLGLITWGVARLIMPAEAEGKGPARVTPRAFGLALIALFALGWAATDQVTISRDQPAPQERGAFVSPTAQLVATQADHLREVREVEERFTTELATAPNSYAGEPGLFAKLQDRDVLVVFIESYGMAVLDVPILAGMIRPRLDTLAQRVEAAGLHMATGAYTSPTQGGQSWYAHGTVLSGLWLDNQPRYDMLIASDRETMVDDFRHAGYQTSAVMPAITMTWPDGERLGFDQMFTAPNIPYAGPPIFWVTMPDQYTWSFIREVRDSAQGRPLFLTAGMVSSHAPWAPILPMLDWDSIGDGRVFERYRAEGHPPETLWLDIGKLRFGYGRSIDYSLQAMTGFAERYVDDRMLLVVIGDHQAAPWVTGGRGNRVPVHVIAKDPALLEPFLESGFLPGAFPDPARRPARMDEFRHWLVRAYSDGNVSSPTTQSPGSAPHPKNGR
jgi:hypothetical protein